MHAWRCVDDTLAEIPFTLRKRAQHVENVVVGKISVVAAPIRSSDPSNLSRRQPDANKSTDSAKSVSGALPIEFLMKNGPTRLIERRNDQALEVIIKQK
jgi:hypothetical protein